MLQPPGEWISEEEGDRGEVRASDDLRTAMARMEVGGEYMDEGEGVEVDKDNGETEEGVLRGGDSGTGIHMDPDSE